MTDEYSEYLSPGDKPYIIVCELTRNNFVAMRRASIYYGPRLTDALLAATGHFVSLMKNESILAFNIVFCAEISEESLETALCSAAFNSIGAAERSGGHDDT